MNLRAYSPSKQNSLVQGFRLDGFTHPARGPASGQRRSVADPALLRMPLLAFATLPRPFFPFPVFLISQRWTDPRFALGIRIRPSARRRT